MSPDVETTLSAVRRAAEILPEGTSIRLAPYPGGFLRAFAKASGGLLRVHWYPPGEIHDGPSVIEVVEVAFARRVRLEIPADARPAVEGDKEAAEESTKRLVASFEGVPF